MEIVLVMSGKVGEVMESYPDVLITLEKSIDDYYYWSFRLAPEKCSSYFIAVLDGMEEIGKYLNKKENNIIKENVKKMLACLERNDHVLLRDIFHYEIKPFISDLRRK